MEVQLRRNQNTLVIVGKGVIAFGVWSVVKAVLHTLLNSSTYLDFQKYPEVSRWAMLIIFTTILLLLLSLTLLLRFRIGRSAIAEGQGKKVKPYLGLAGFLTAVNMISFGMQVWSLFHSPASASTTLAAMLVDLTSVVTLVELLAAAVQVRKIKQQLAERES